MALITSRDNEKLEVIYSSMALGVAAALVAVVAACGSSGKGARLSEFVGGWGGHDRGLGITRAGRGTETIDTGCCQRAITLRFRITKVWGSVQRPLATATVTCVHIYFPGWFTKKNPAPHVGKVGTLRIVKGILLEPLGGDTYCNGNTPEPKNDLIGSCGA